jgi:hypothetical protein
LCHCSRSFAASTPATDNSVHRTADEWIGQQSQERGYDQGLTRVNFVEHDDFIDQIDQDRDDEDPGQLSPSLSQQFVPVNRIGEDGPAIGRAPGPCVSEACTARDNGRRQGLEDQSKRTRSVHATNEV